MLPQFYTSWTIFCLLPKLKNNVRARDLQNSIFMCDYLGVPLVPEKLVGPDKGLQFAGITVDSVLFEARLPEDVLAKCRVTLHNFYTRGTVTLKELHGRY